MLITAANEQDRASVGELTELVQGVTGEHVELAYVDQGYTGEDAAAAAAEQGIRLSVVRLLEAKRGSGSCTIGGLSSAVSRGWPASVTRHGTVNTYWYSWQAFLWWPLA